MSYSRTPARKPTSQARAYSQTPTSISNKYQHPVVDTVGHTNLDDFFSQPSAHELSVADHLFTTSESRVLEIISDLQQQTTKQLEIWSPTSSAYSAQTKEKQSSTSPCPTPSVEVTSPTPDLNIQPPTYAKAQFIPDTDLVSSPLYLSSPILPFLTKSSNLATVLKSKFSRRRHTRPPQTTTHPTPTPQQASTHLEQHSKPQPLSSPPNFSNPQTRHRTTYTGTTNKPTTKQDDNNNLSPTKPSFQSFLKRVPNPTARDPSSSSITHIRSHSSDPSPSPPPQTSTIISTTPSSKKNTLTTPQQRQNSSKHTLRRKPLPQSSPLLVPLSAHPAFAEVPHVDTSGVATKGGGDADVVTGSKVGVEDG